MSKIDDIEQEAKKEQQEPDVDLNWIAIALTTWAIVFTCGAMLFKPDELFLTVSIFIVGCLISGGIGWMAENGLSSSNLTTPIKNKAKDIFVEQQRKELSDYITLLRNADDEEVGLALAASLNFAYYFQTETTIDLFEPGTALMVQPDLAFQFAKQIEEAQASGNVVDSTQKMVWAHTLRAWKDGQLRGLGRELWGELISRGMTHVGDHKESIEMFTGKPAMLQRLGDVPVGLMPRNMDNSKPNEAKTTGSKKKRSAKKRLEELQKLHQDGLVTDDVFEKMQVEILRDQ